MHGGALLYYSFIIPVTNEKRTRKSAHVTRAGDRIRIDVEETARRFSVVPLVPLAPKGTQRYNFPRGRPFL